jgi:hypothetical protein
MRGFLMVVVCPGEQTGHQNHTNNTPRSAGPMTTETSVTTRTSTFTPAEQRALRTLRTRYQQDSDLWNSRERATPASGHPRFLRWLYQTGQLGEAVCHA